MMLSTIERVLGTTAMVHLHRHDGGVLAVRPDAWLQMIRDAVRQGMRDVAGLQRDLLHTRCVFLAWRQHARESRAQHAVRRGRSAAWAACRWEYVWRRRVAARDRAARRGRATRFAAACWRAHVLSRRRRRADAARRVAAAFAAWRQCLHAAAVARRAFATWVAFVLSRVRARALNAWVRAHLKKVRRAMTKARRERKSVAPSARQAGITCQVVGAADPANRQVELVMLWQFVRLDMMHVRSIVTTPLRLCCSVDDLLPETTSALQYFVLSGDELDQIHALSMAQRYDLVRRVLESATYLGQTSFLRDVEKATRYRNSRKRSSKRSQETVIPRNARLVAQCVSMLAKASVRSVVAAIGTKLKQSGGRFQGFDSVLPSSCHPSVHAIDSSVRKYWRVNRNVCSIAAPGKCVVNESKMLKWLREDMPIRKTTPQTFFLNFIQCLQPC